MTNYFAAKKIYYLDLAERALWTFAQGFAAEWVVTASLDAGSFKLGLVAGLASVAKSIVAKGVGDSDSAATLTSPPDYAPGE